MAQFTDGFSSFAAPDLDAVRAFYRDVVGLEVGELMGQLSLTLPGGARVFVYQKDDHQPAVFTVLNLVVGDVAAAVDDLVGRGVTLERYDGFDQDERGIASGLGPDIAWFTDPAGNVVSVIGEDTGESS